MRGVHSPAGFSARRACEWPISSIRFISAGLSASFECEAAARVLRAFETDCRGIRPAKPEACTDCDRARLRESGRKRSDAQGRMGPLAPPSGRGGYRLAGLASEAAGAPLKAQRQ